MNDKEINTAEQVGTIGECLYSLGNRIEVAKILNQAGKIKLLETTLEDIGYFTQSMIDEYCVEKPNVG